MKTGNSALFQFGVSEEYLVAKELQAQIILGSNHRRTGSDFRGSGNNAITEDFLPVCSIVPGQLLSFYKSLQLGLMPDNPSVSGSISRIVEGVNIYPEPGYLK
jgi:tagatose-6-phosphate ketose/aldose isomerase